MVKVYFESNNHAELVAIFRDDEAYNYCINELHDKASDMNMIVTESVDEEVDLADLEDLASLDVLTQLKNR